MSYTFNPAAEAASNRRWASRSYRDARKLAQQAAEQYEWARKHAKHVNDLPLTGVAQEDLVRALISLADTLLQSSFSSTDRAREYAARARRYERMAAERSAA